MIMSRVVRSAALGRENKRKPKGPRFASPYLGNKNKRTNIFPLIINLLIPWYWPNIELSSWSRRLPYKEHGTVVSLCIGGEGV